MKYLQGLCLNVILFKSYSHSEDQLRSNHAKIFFILTQRVFGYFSLHAFVLCAVILLESCGSLSQKDKVGENESCTKVGEYRVKDQKLWVCEQNSIPYSGAKTTKEWYLKLDCSAFEHYSPQMLGDAQYLNCINNSGDLVISTNWLTPFCGEMFLNDWVAVRYYEDLKEGVDRPFYLKCADRDPKCFPGKFEENQEHRRSRGTDLFPACPQSDEPYKSEPE